MRRYEKGEQGQRSLMKVEHAEFEGYVESQKEGESSHAHLLFKNTISHKNNSKILDIE